MIEFGKEYFNKPYYFYLKDRGDKFSVYYSVSDTINESRKNDDEVIFLKESLDKVTKFIGDLLKKGYKFTKEQLKKIFDLFKNKDDKKIDGELKEFIGSDGSFLNSNIPMLNQRQVTKSTTDQTVHMTRANQFPFRRVYYGESEDEKDNLIDETDMFDAFGYRETKNARTYKDASKILKSLGVDDPFERHDRLETMGFDPEYDKELKQQKKVGHCKNCFTKRRLSELEKGKMQKMIDEVILKKKSKSDGVINKDEESDNVISKILVRNIEAVKRIADKEGVSIDKLIKHLKTGE